MVVPALINRPLDLLIVVFLASHIPITLLVDSQSVLPSSWYPQWAQNTLHWYLDQYHDPLVEGNPVWFKALVATEIVLQLPFFICGTYAVAAGKQWIRLPALVYGSFVTATLVPILAELAVAPPPAHRGTLFVFYLPYLIMPLLIAIKMLFNESPFEVQTNHKKLM